MSNVESLNLLYEIFLEQENKQRLNPDSRIHTLYISVEKNDKITLHSSEKIYVTSSLKTEEEDEVLTHLIMLAPQEVIVHEDAYDGRLSRETVIILQHLFKDRVTFTNGKVYAYHHQKEQE